MGVTGIYLARLPREPAITRLIYWLDYAWKMGSEARSKINEIS
jgi:hypothetical protein